MSLKRYCADALARLRGWRRRRCAETPGVSFARVLADEQRLINPQREDLFGLALSGGGIRSATFNLGVLQGLARHGLLSRAHYLSTVSGGGYIGSWLSAWLAESKAGIDNLEPILAATDDEPKPVSYLREYSNYLTPRVGWLSADSLTMAATYLRNFLLNLAIIVSWFSLLMLVPWVLGRFADTVEPVWLVLCSGGLLAFAVSGVVANVVWQELDENTLAKPGEKRNDPPFFTRPLWIGLVIVLPLVVWAYFLSTALNRDADLLDFATSSVAAVGLCAGFVIIRQLFLLRRARRGRLTGRFSLWRRGIAFVLGTLAALALITLLAGQLHDLVAIWHVIVWGVPALLAVFLLGATLVLGISGRTESEYAREWWSRLGGLVFRVMLLWIVLTGAAIYGPLLVALLGALATAHLSAAWVLTTIASVVVGKSSATGAEGSRRWLELVPKIGPYVFIAGMLVAVSSFLYWVLTDGASGFGAPHNYFEELDLIGVERVAMVAAGLLVVALVLSSTVDVNLFSFHMFYRNRLVRCYLGATRSERRRALPFIGFDPKDNPPLRSLPVRPFHIINTALNLTSSERLGWQERKAASFVVTPLYCGYEYPNVGPSGDAIKNCFQRTDVYASRWKGSLNLGTAMAISGAAANPNMGYHSSPSVAFLLTVFNVRLGWWMQNTSSTERWSASGPHFGVRYLLRELLGLSSDRSQFVQLSDGGHFENLGIYELVRRRCRFIVVTDASEDKTFKFEDLGNAIRKACIDQLADIEIDTDAIVPVAGKPYSLHHCAVGTIRYRKGPPGYLLYIKPTLTGNEPADVGQYAAAKPAFPHESTGDQFFSESQFESYRKLGYHICNAVFEDAVQKARPAHQNPRSVPAAATAVDLEALFVALKERWSAPASASAGAFAKHGDGFSKLQDTLRTDRNLAFLNAEVYPEWSAVLEGAVPATQGDASPAPARKRDAPDASDLWLPPTIEERRAGFHFCNGMLQLMENVYVDLNLQQEHEHPDNRGWMNLFRQWSWAGMFQVTYAVCGAMYGARFQTFCESVLGLEPGEVRLDCGDLSKKASLNFVEQDIVTRLLSFEVIATTDEMCLLQSVLHSSPDANGRRAAFNYTFGFVVIRDGAVRYFRIQDHVRQMGNARRALIRLLRAKPGLRFVRSRNHEDKVGAALYEPHDFEGFERLFRSVQQQLRAQRAPPITPAGSPRP